MGILWFFLTIIIGVVVGIIIGWYSHRKLQMKKMRQMEDDVNNWKRIQTANQYGIPLKATITRVIPTDGTEPETTEIEITAIRKFAGTTKRYRFKDTFIVNNDSHARFQIPCEG